MNFYQKRNILIAAGAIGGVIVFANLQSRIRMKGFDEGFSCLLKGYNSDARTATPGCFDYFEGKINTLKAEIDEQPETQSGDLKKLKLEKRIDKWNEFFNSGAWKNYPNSD